MARPLRCLVAMTSILSSKKTRIVSFWGSFCATWALLIAACYIKLTGSVANWNSKGICGPCNPVEESAAVGTVQTTVLEKRLSTRLSALQDLSKSTSFFWLVAWFPHTLRNMIFCFKRGPRIDFKWVFHGFPVFLCQIRVSWMLDRQTLPRVAVFSILDVVSHGGKPVHLGVTICNGLKRCANNTDPSTYHCPNNDECKRFHYPYSGGCFFWKYGHLCTPNPCDSTFKSIRKQWSCPVQHQLPWSAFHFCW